MQKNDLTVKYKKGIIRAESRQRNGCCRMEEEKHYYDLDLGHKDLGHKVSTTKDRQK